MSHTPGPWGWTYDGSSDYSIGEHFDPQVHPIATVHDRNADRGAANCSLIAAAPDLLEAAKHAAMEWRLHGQLTDSCRVLERAIAKAEGR